MPNFKKNTSPAMKKSPFTMKNPYPYPTVRKGKINPNSEGNTDLPDGRSGSAAFQKKSAVKNYKKGYYGA